jgi:hypothetical protein
MLNVLLEAVKFKERSMSLFFTEKPIFYKGIGCISFVGTKNNRKGHRTKNCSALKHAKKVFTYWSKEDFDIIECRKCG